MSYIENLRRAERARVAVEAYAREQGYPEEEEAETRLSDLLTDLRHLAVRTGVDFESCARLSLTHLHAESGEECYCTNCPSCGGERSVCDKCKNCTRCHAHAPDCLGCFA